MKLVLITASIVCMSLGTALIAQNSNADKRETITMGLKAGLNYANVWDVTGQDFDSEGRFGFVGGIFFGIPLGEFMGFQPEVLISQKGFQGSGTLFVDHYSYSKTNTYLDIPLQIQVKPAEYITVVGGIQYSYLLKEKTVYTYGNNSSVQEEAFNADNIRKNLFGALGGVDGYINDFVVSGRFGWDITANHGDGSSSTPRYKNRWLQLTLGYRI